MLNLKYFKESQYYVIILKNILKKINYPRRQGLEFSHISEMNITLIASLNLMTYKHYIDQPIPTIERLFNIKFCKKI